MAVDEVCTAPPRQAMQGLEQFFSRLESRLFSGQFSLISLFSLLRKYDSIMLMRSSN